MLLEVGVLATKELEKLQKIGTNYNPYNNNYINYKDVCTLTVMTMNIKQCFDASYTNQHFVLLFYFQRFLDDYSQTLLMRDGVKDAISNFKTALRHIADSIKARNASLPLPYTILLPERIPAGIAI